MAEFDAMRDYLLDLGFEETEEGLFVSDDVLVEFGSETVTVALLIPDSDEVEVVAEVTTLDELKELFVEEGSDESEGGSDDSVEESVQVARLRKSLEKLSG